jgi:hypothetical protein
VTSPTTFEGADKKNLKLQTLTYRKKLVSTFIIGGAAGVTVASGLIAV